MIEDKLDAEKHDTDLYDISNRIEKLESVKVSRKQSGAIS